MEWLLKGIRDDIMNKNYFNLSEEENYWFYDWILIVILVNLFGYVFCYFDYFLSGVEGDKNKGKNYESFV